MRPGPEDCQAQLDALTRRLAETEQLFRQLLDHLPVGMAFLDAQLVFRQANPAYARLVGRPIEAILERPFHQLFPLVKPTHLEQVLRTGQPMHIADVPLSFVVEGQLRSVDWDVVLLPARGESGAIEGVVIYGLDVTACAEARRRQKALQAQVEDLSALKNEFVTAAAHELRTPLTIVAGNLELLADTPGLGPEQHRLLDEAASGADRLKVIIDDLLAITHLKAGLFKPDRQPTDLVGLIRTVIEALAPRAEAKLLALGATLPEGPVEASIDAGAIAQVLELLLTNALKFTPAGGQVTVSLAIGPEDLRVTVADTGLGIDPAQQQHLFEPMYQSDPNLPGAGLGLAVASGLIAAHGGRIGVESAPGSGSRFWFTLPRAGGP